MALVRAHSNQRNDVRKAAMREAIVEDVMVLVARASRPLFRSVEAQKNRRRDAGAT
jgi:hypothetical protein